MWLQLFFREVKFWLLTSVHNSFLCILNVSRWAVWGENPDSVQESETNLLHMVIIWSVRNTDYLFIMHICWTSSIIMCFSGLVLSTVARLNYQVRKSGVLYVEFGCSLFVYVGFLWEVHSPPPHILGSKSIGDTEIALWVVLCLVVVCVLYVFVLYAFVSEIPNCPCVYFMWLVYRLNLSDEWLFPVMNVS